MGFREAPDEDDAHLILDMQSRPTIPIRDDAKPGSSILFTATQIFIHQRVFLDLLQLVAFMTIPFNI
ncbi:hypothetical protein LOK49_LG15G00110 [Camellia lanceoleosa]|uniref:Uncharacterized protein n=1 Tax=Camellia lanceoleosa TaxID=1840588 RepID=A0ACC0F7F8_9ERIC|nr:hypothetical protein LOK49_LG15G00110 [Camellia lanceoleosa]